MNVNAPMPGTVITVKVKVGDSVTKGQEMVIMEALKMKNAIRTPQDGVVKEIHVKDGQQVQTGAALVTVE
jgi:biotin carboxyl carrier protein